MENAKATALVFVAFAITAFAVVSTADFADEVREQIVYCKNVRAGVWPDFRGNFAVECTPSKIKKLYEFLD